MKTRTEYRITETRWSNGTGTYIVQRAKFNENGTCISSWQDLIAPEEDSHLTAGCNRLQYLRMEDAEHYIEQDKVTYNYMTETIIHER